MSRGPPGLERWFDIDPYLTFYRTPIIERFLRFNTFRKKLSPNKDLTYVTKAYEYFGIHIDSCTAEVTVREWAPGAKALFFTGDFNLWNRESHPFTKLDDGVWELFIPAKANGRCVLSHLCEVKIVIQKWDDTKHDRLSPWATYVAQSLIPTDTQFRQILWYPPQYKVYEFRFPKPTRPRSLKIYECHIGIATGGIDKGIEVGTYKKFTRMILPRIKANGYNAIQMMAIMEHAYYASFGYQVTSFYAVSSRYGTPEELKELIDTAHSMNLYVILDLVHSHASDNVNDGLNEFDGTKGCFFYDDSRGYHSQWGSRMFNTNDMTVLRFLISNACWFVDQYNVDGFRFDGVTAMLYKSRGINQSFTGHYDEYFGNLVDPNGPLYCQLINYFLHKQYPNMITIAEEVSGMPGICRPCYEGGFGFDYRLAMSIPDKWISMLKNERDEDWNLGDLVWTHANRRHRERNVAYCESHDQALVGDKTISFWLMDSKMYYEMKRKRVQNVVIDRGVALHKMIRLFTHALGGEAYMNFIGNEFGHPEWLDFPRRGNAWSYHYCRRQWNLVDNKSLLYANLNAFDRAMNIAEEKYGWLRSPEAYVSLKHEADKVVVFERADLVFVFNFHVTQSFSDYRIGVNRPGEYECILCTDDRLFAGHDRVDASIHHATEEYPHCNRAHSLKVYIPNRAAIVLGCSNDVLIREEEFNKNIVKTFSQISLYARATISTTSIPSSKQPASASVSSTDSGLGVHMPYDGRSLEAVASLVAAALTEKPPLGEIVGGGETPFVSTTSVLYDGGLEVSTSGSSSGSTSDSSLTIVDSSMDVLDPIEEVTEPTGTESTTTDSSSLISRLEKQFGPALTGRGGIALRSYASLVGSSSTSDDTVKRSDVTMPASDSSKSKYDTASSSGQDSASSSRHDTASSSRHDTASSSRQDTADSANDYRFDMNLWGMSSTSSLTNEDVMSAIENLPAEKPEEFYDAFEELSDDDE